jgi:hypothetical protein
MRFYTQVMLGDCLALLPCHPAQFSARSAHPPSRRCRVAQRRQYCPSVQTCESGEMGYRRGNANALSALYLRGKSPSVRPHIKNAAGSVHMLGTPTDALNKTFRCGWCGVFRGGEIYCRGTRLECQSPSAMAISPNPTAQDMLS